MDSLIIKEGIPLLSFLIFFPLAGAVVLLFFNGEKFARYWTLAITLITAAFSISLITGFDTTTAKFQFAEVHNWIPQLNIHLHNALGKADRKVFQSDPSHTQC